MTIIPYIRSGCLDSNTLRHFNTIREAAEWAFDDMFAQPDNTDTIQKRFRIIDTEEDFTVSFSKKRWGYNCSRWMVWTLREQ